MTIADKVELILKYDPKSRDSDRRLLLIYVQKSGLNLSPEQIEVFNSLPAFETIRRTRQSLQEQGKYPASEKVNEERYAKYQAMRGGGHMNPAETLEAPSDALQALTAGAVPTDLPVETNIATDPFPIKKYYRQPLDWKTDS